MIVEEYFKMMGGLRSIVEIGFSLVALGNFTSQSWQLLNKILDFLMKTSHKFARKVGSMGVPTTATKKVLRAISKGSGPTIQDKLFFALRILSAFCNLSFNSATLLCIKLRREIEVEVETEREEILKQYQEAREDE